MTSFADDATWYTQAAVPAPERPALTFDLDTDVCVIGGGLAGLTVARELARRNWSVALIEAQTVAALASGRGAGLVLPGFAQRASRIVERCGLAHAKALWGLSEAGVAYVRNAIADIAMPGVDPVAGWLDVSQDDDADDLMPTLTLLGQELGAEVEGWPAERVRDVLRSERYYHALHFPNALHINPLNYALGLAADAERHGARLFERTAALEFDPVGVRKPITTQSGRIRANHIVMAGNAHLDRVAPELAATILPLTKYVAVTEPIPRLAELVAFPGAVTDRHGADSHYRVIDSDRLLWSSGATVWQGDPRRHGQRIAAVMADTYPQLRGVAIHQAWAGTMGVAVHRMPQIGELAPGLWLANAFAGHGINATAMAGELIARAIVQHDDTWRLFLPYDLVWAGGLLGRAVMQASYWARDAGELMRSWKRRRREPLGRVPAAA